MRSPTAADVVRLWELGRDRPQWFRGLLLLAPSFPAWTFRDLASLTIGQRNICLFALRERLFGSRIVARVRCPHCAALSEFTASVDDLCLHRAGSEIAPARAVPEFALEVDGAGLRCRCLTSDDLAMTADTAGIGLAGNAALLRRAVVEAEPGVSDPPVGPLSGTVTEALLDALIAHDPQSELLIGIDCPDCHQAWSAPFDIAAFLWTETANLAQRLLHDVHLLAGAYGWREADIITMSAARRQFYIERTGH